MFPDMTNNEVAEELIHTVNHLQEEFIIERLSELAKNGNWSPVGMSREQLTSLIQTNKLREHLRNSGFSASDADKELLNSIGFSAGFIPNFGSIGGFIDVPVQAASRWWENTRTALGLSSDSEIANEGLNLSKSQEERMYKWQDILYNAEMLAGEGGRNIDDLAKRSGVTSQYIRNSLLTTKGIESAKKAINNAIHSGQGTQQDIEQVYGAYKKNVEKLKNGFEGAKKAGLNFENQLRIHFGHNIQQAGMNAGNHMDFHEKEFEGPGQDKKKPDILMRQNTVHGDAYHGEGGHPKAHFGGKLFRQLVEDEGGLGKKRFSEIRAVLDEESNRNTATLSQSATKPYADIIASKNSKDQYVKAEILVSELAAHSKNNFRKLLNLGTEVDPDEYIEGNKILANRKVKFNYWRDYVDKTQFRHYRLTRMLSINHQASYLTIKTSIKCFMVMILSQQEWILAIKLVPERTGAIITIIF